MRRAAGLLLLTVASALLAQSDAHASCASAVVVDGHVLLGGRVPHPERLPSRGVPLPAVVPACDDGDGERREDGRTTVRTLRGVPRHVAVVVGRALYVTEGSLLLLRGHPLRPAFEPPPSRRHPRDRPACRRLGATALTMRAPISSRGFVTRLDGDEQFVRLDPRTRLTNRPVTQPIADGQRVTVRAWRCGKQLVADRIALTGATVPPPRYGTSDGGGAGIPAWLRIAVGSALLLGLAVVVRRLI